MVRVILNSDIIKNPVESVDVKSYQNDEYFITKLTKNNKNGNNVTAEDNTKETTDENNAATSLVVDPWLRSVVWERSASASSSASGNDNINYIPVCVSPPREWNLSGNFQSTKTLLEDFVEGTMINVFVTARHPEPQVATRSSLGAAGTFYSERTFMELFKDALNEEGRSLDGTTFPLQTDTAPKNAVAHFWSFVLQHPENRFVGIVTKPGLVLVHEGWTLEDGEVIINQRPTSDTWQLPIKYDCELCEDAIWKRVDELSKVYGPTWQGLVLRRDDGGRVKFVQAEYLRLRSWRAEPRQDIRLIWLVNESSAVVAEYMKYFPEDLERFLELNSLVERLCRDLYYSYQEVHIRRMKKLEDVRDFLRPHVFTLHGKYLNVLKPKGWFVRRKEVREYISELPWQRLNYIIRRLEGKISAPLVRVNGDAGSACGTVPANY